MELSQETLNLRVLISYQIQCARAVLKYHIRATTKISLKRVEALEGFGSYELNPKPILKR